MKDKTDIISRLVLSFMTYKPAAERTEIVVNLVEALDALPGWQLERACANLTAREQYLPTIAAILRAAKELTPDLFARWRQLCAQAEAVRCAVMHGEFDRSEWLALCDEMEWCGMGETAARNRARAGDYESISAAYAEAVYADALPG